MNGGHGDGDLNVSDFEKQTSVGIEETIPREKQSDRRITGVRPTPTCHHLAYIE